MYHTRLGHAHLTVHELDRAIAFYTRFFDLRLIERVGDGYAVLGGDGVHPELSLQAAGAVARIPHSYASALYHVGFELPDGAALAAAYTALTDAAIEVEAVDHRVSWSLYFRDPDGNGLALYWDRRGEPDSAHAWCGHNLALPAEKLLAPAQSGAGQEPANPAST